MKKTLRKLEAGAKYFIYIVAIVICGYTLLFSLTFFLWGDPSVHGQPQLLHPPQIVALQLAGMISPALAGPIAIFFFGNVGIVIIILGIRQLNRKKSLDNPVRKKIRDYVDSHPGRHFRSIMRETGINRGTLSYHIYQLKRLGIIQEIKDGGLTRYYVHLNGSSPLEQKLIAHRDNPLRDRILTTLQEKGPVLRSELKNDLGISGPALWYHMHLLLHDGIVYAGQAGDDVGKPLQYSLTHMTADLLNQGSGNSGGVAGENPKLLPALPGAGGFTAEKNAKMDETIKIP